MKKDIEKYLIPGDRPLVILPELARELGLEQAVVLQQLHWLLRDERNGKFINGKRWVFNTYDDWVKNYFVWMSERTLRRVFLELETLGAIESCQPEGGISRRKYYRMLIGGTK